MDVVVRWSRREDMVKIDMSFQRFYPKGDTNG